MTGCSLKALRGEKITCWKFSGKKIDHAKRWFGLSHMPFLGDFDGLYALRLPLLKPQVCHANSLRTHIT